MFLPPEPLPPQPKMSTININNYPSTPLSTSKTHSSTLSTPQTLTPPLTLIPPSALTQKATSSTTKSKHKTPVIEQTGPVVVAELGTLELESESESDDDEKKSTSRKKKQKKSNRSKNASSTDDSESSSSSDSDSSSTAQTPKLKKGYLPKSHTSPSNDDEDFEFGEPGESDGGAEGGSRVWHTHEMSISTTREGLEGGGKRTVCVRTERNDTVLGAEPGGGGTGKG